MSKAYTQRHSGEDRDLSYYRGVKGKILWQEKHVVRLLRRNNYSLPCVHTATPVVNGCRLLTAPSGPLPLCKGSAV